MSDVRVSMQRSIYGRLFSGGQLEFVACDGCVESLDDDEREERETWYAQVCFFFQYQGENLAYVRWLQVEDNGNGESESEVEEGEDEGEGEGSLGDRGGLESGTDSSNAGDTDDEVRDGEESHGFEQMDGDDEVSISAEDVEEDGDSDLDSNADADGAASSASSNLSEEEHFPFFRSASK